MELLTCCTALGSLASLFSSSHQLNNELDQKLLNSSKKFVNKLLERFPEYKLDELKKIVLLFIEQNKLSQKEIDCILKQLSIMYSLAHPNQAPHQQT